MTITRLDMAKPCLPFNLDPDAGDYVINSTFIASFDTVPQGSVWTGSVSACMLANFPVSGTSVYTLEGNNSLPNLNTHNEILQSVVWTLFRNGFAEYTWIGSSMLCNFQAWGGDVITVLGEIPTAGNSIYQNTPPTSGAIAQGIMANNATQFTNMQVRWTGYASDNAQQTPIQVPFLSSAPGNPSQGLMSPSQRIQVAFASVNTNAATSIIPVPTGVPAGYFPMIQLWSISLTASAVSTTAAPGENHTITVTDNFGNTYAALTIQTLAGQPVANSTTVDCKGIMLTCAGITNQMPLVVEIPITGTYIGRVTATVYYSWVNAVQSG
jgi:hypothetical protein